MVRCGNEDIHMESCVECLCGYILRMAQDDRCCYSGQRPVYLFRHGSAAVIPAPVAFRTGIANTA